MIVSKLKAEAPKSFQRLEWSRIFNNLEQTKKIVERLNLLYLIITMIFIFTLSICKADVKNAAG